MLSKFIEFKKISDMIYLQRISRRNTKMVKELTDTTFEEATKTGVTLTDFWATWCGPCRMQSPVVEELDEEMNDKVSFGKVDVDQNKQVASEFGIMSIPTLLIKKDGQVVDTLVGYHPKEQIKSKLEQYI
ncbi:thioredoxin [Liquorilactobacillus ghanensis DSM 18630]|jgi:thioredoxin 1|uniref:Thioredoxin n=2 Tax=Liquorilactobacillus ghanensis TaxID=399370 RepID=A0A0R1VM97_9LACO|nr:thioredoxin [Liquorilactobacillus ghanensis DSM 18630]